VANRYGIFFLDGSLSNLIYYNNFLNNTRQVYDFSWDPPPVPPSRNTWDEGYPSGGNYWSDYSGVDKKSGTNQDRHGSDGIGDTPYVIDENNQDNRKQIDFQAIQCYSSTYHGKRKWSNTETDEFHSPS